MANTVLFLFILTIINSVLFYSKALGINVILFIIPLLIYLVFVLKKNGKIKNKKGLLFLVPITLLSLSYTIYDNATFSVLNALAIPALIIMMYIFTINPTDKIGRLIKDIVNLIFEPLSCIGKFFNIVGMKLDKLFKLSKESKKQLKSILIVVPVVIIVLILLSNADKIFGNLMGDFLKVFKNIRLENIIGRFILGLLFFGYAGAVTNYLLFNYSEKERKEEKKKIEAYTINVLLTVLNIIYIVFDFIQIRSLMLQKVAENINYAEYARHGFFQLLFISFINITIILLSKRTKNNEKETYTNIMSLLMVLLTIVIIASSFIRMHMYEAAFGYTTLRLLVYATLITEVVLMIPTIIYIFNFKVNILRYYLIITILAYTTVSLSPIDRIIATENINRYYKTNKIDIVYLENYRSDNIPLLIDIKDDLKNNHQKEELDLYLKEMKNNTKTKGFQEYNLSKKIAHQKLKELNN